MTEADDAPGDRPRPHEHGPDSDGTGGGQPGDDSQTDGAPRFGPGGYLPERASRRARKIMLRAPLGVEWIVASIVAGIVVLVAGVLFLRSAGSPPGEPFVEVIAVERLDDAMNVPDLGIVLVGVGRVRAFPTGDDPPRWCETSGRLESPAGRMWSPTGRALDGGASLAAHPTVVHAGTIYVDLSRTEPGPPGQREGDAAPACPAG